MATNKQVAANRRNARRSTGPKTVDGKSVSKMNAIKHGLRATIDVLPDESAAEFESLQARVIEEFEPVGTIEAHLVRQVAVCLWRMERLFTIETGILLNSMIENYRRPPYGRSELTEELKEQLYRPAAIVGSAFTRSERSNPLSLTGRRAGVYSFDAFFLYQGQFSRLAGSLTNLPFEFAIPV